jgi:peptide chain release factor subunit 1
VLKRTKCTPKNGLVIYAGVIARIENDQDANQLHTQNVIPAAAAAMESESDGKSTQIECHRTTMPTLSVGKRFVHSLEPPAAAPIRRKQYICSNQFDVSVMQQQLEEGHKHGIIIIDGSECTMAMMRGDQMRVIHTASAHIPPATRRGGQSANRYARIRDELRAEFIKKQAEVSRDLFLDSNNARTQVDGLILAGPASTKHELSRILDPVLHKSILCTVDTAYTGKNGLNEVLHKAKTHIADHQVVKDQHQIEEFMKGVATANPCTVYGATELQYALENHLLKTLIVAEECTLVRCVKMNHHGYGTSGKVTSDSDSDSDAKDTASQQLWCPNDRVPKGYQVSHTLVDWLVDHSHTLRVDELIIVSSSSSVGHQFISGFGGIGGVTRYPVDLSYLLDDKLGQGSDYINDYLSDSDLGDDGHGLQDCDA